MKNRLLTNSVVFFAGTLVFSVFNYLYNSRVGKMLGPAEYSVIGSLLAFISILTLPTNAVSTVAMRFAAHYHAKDEDGTIHTFFNRLTKWLVVVGVIAALIVIALSKLLANYLHIPSATPVMLVAPILAFTILLPLNRGILQGLQNFFQSVINQNIDPLIKLVLGLLLVKLGYGANGAIGAIVVGAGVAYALSFIPLKVITSKKPTDIKEIPKEVKEFSVIALVAFLLATLLMNIDIILVKHFLSPYEAGLYSALSTMGKIVLFVTTPVVSVMFPMISDLQGRDEKHYKLLFQSILLVTVIGLIGVAGYYLLPELVVKILYGKDYLATAPLLGFFGLIMLLYSLVNLWVNYFLSIGNKFFVSWLAASAILEITLLSIRHQNFTFILQDLLAAMLVGFIGLTGYYLFLKRQQLTERFTTIKFTGPSAG